MDIAGQRMVNQRLWGPPFAGVADAVRGLGAVQSQEFPYARWSVAQRAGDVPESLVDKAFAEGAILRTHVLRPTWHFVAPQDIRWMLELTGPRVHALSAPYYRREGLTDFDRPTGLFVEALRGGNQLDRKGMRAVLEEAGMAVTPFQLGLILMHAELDAVLCSGAPQGKQHTYALLEERAPNALRLSREEALVELVRRYFTTHGPATLKDFAWWSGLTQADGRKGLAALDFNSSVHDGRTYWGPPAPTHERTQPRVDLVQIYDEIGVAYTESRDVILPVGMPLWGPTAYYHSILLNGRLIGHWRRTVTGKSVSFETQPLRPLKKAEAKALEEAQERYRRFVVTG
jgi:DNA glycosylase AlkZ-like